MANKITVGTIGGGKMIAELNSEDKGITYIFTVPKGSKVERDVILKGLNSSISKTLRQHLKPADYKNYITRMIENLADNLSAYREESDSDDQVIYKISMKENGTCTQWLNNRKIHEAKWPKNVMLDTLNDFRYNLD